MAKYDPLDRDAIEREEKEAAARERQARQRDDDDLRFLLASRQGRRVAWRLLERAGVNTATFNANALQMAFNEGFRNYGTWLLTRILEVSPDAYPKMLKEQADERDSTGSGPKPK